MLTRLRNKLRCKAGITYTSTLTAFAVLALVGAAMTMGIHSALHIYRDVTALSSSEILAGTILTALEDEFRFAENIKSKDDGSVVAYDSAVFGDGVAIFYKDDGKDDGQVRIGKTDSKGLRLLSSRSYLDGLLKAHVETKLKSDKSVTITVRVGPNPPDVTYAKHQVTVRPINSQ